MSVFGFKRASARVYIAAAAIVLAVSAITVALFSMILGAHDGIDPPPSTGTEGTNVPATTNTASTKPEDLKKNAYNFIVAGTDAEGGLTDTLMVVHFNTDTGELNILQIPRDTYVDYGKSYHKINGANAYGGVELLQQTIEENLGIEIHHWAIVNLKAFRLLVDEIDGVEVEVPSLGGKGMQYTDPYQNLTINLKPGLQTLNGVEAEGFVRFRKGYADEDLGRLNAQKQFLAALAKKLFNVKNVLKIPALAQIFFDNVKTDMNVGDIISFAYAGLKLDMDSIRAMTLPGEPCYYNKGNYFTGYYAETLEVVNQYFNTTSEEIGEIGLMELMREYTSSATDASGKTLGELADEGQKVNTKPGYSSKTATTTPASTKTPSSTAPVNNTPTTDTAGTKTEDEEEESASNVPGLTTETTAPAKPTVRINYSCENRDKLSDFVSKLKNAGYKIVEQVAASGVVYKYSMIIEQTEGVSSSGAQSLLPFAEVGSSVEQNASADITIILGKDFDESY